MLILIFLYAFYRAIITPRTTHLLSILLVTDLTNPLDTASSVAPEYPSEQFADKVVELATAVDRLGITLGTTAPPMLLAAATHRTPRSPLRIGTSRTLARLVATACFTEQTTGSNPFIHRIASFLAINF